MQEFIVALIITISPQQNIVEYVSGVSDEQICQAMAQRLTQQYEGNPFVVKKAYCTTRAMYDEYLFYSKTNRKDNK